MYRAVSKILNQTTIQYTFLKEEKLLAYKEVIDLWQKDNDFRSNFISTLKKCPCPAYFWETPPVNILNQNQIFKCVCVNSSRLKRISANFNAFQEHFDKAVGKEEVISFPNLGKNALLVVPCPLSEHENYSHLANFMRQAPLSQIHTFWRRVGAEAERRINEKPFWLSTAGLGVSWLHLRLDDRPKYYKHREFVSIGE